MPPADVAVVNQTAAMLRACQFPKWFVECVWQSSAARSWVGSVEAACFLRVWAALQTGRLAICEINVGRGPARDADIASNASAIAELPQPFSGEVQNVKEYSDGVLRWSSAIMADINHTGSRWSAALPPSQVPLEIGATSATRTLMHILEPHRGVARWPYGSESIWVLKLLGKEPA